MTTMSVHRVGIVLKPNKPEAGPVVQELIAWLRPRGRDVILDSEAAAACPACGPGHSRADVVAQADLIVVLGGDGTILAVSRLMGARQIPILGVNVGGLGFLTEVALAELFPALEAVLKDEYAVSRRRMLSAQVRRVGASMREFEALNDFVINKTAASRIVELETFVNGEYVATYRADGLIMASPTGSTAYCLSAGGPILYPTLPALVVIPICPHTLTNRPLVLPDSATIEVVQRSSTEDVHLTVDGQVDVGLQPRDVVVVRRSAHVITLVKSPKLNYFELLRTKLRWGER
jgi:NAD+ kinase